jgi:hypothetical protein
MRVVPIGVMGDCSYMIMASCGSRLLVFQTDFMGAQDEFTITTAVSHTHWQREMQLTWSSENCVSGERSVIDAELDMLDTAKNDTSQELKQTLRGIFAKSRILEGKKDKGTMGGGVRRLVEALSQGSRMEEKRKVGKISSNISNEIASTDEQVGNERHKPSRDEKFAHSPSKQGATSRTSQLNVQDNSDKDVEDVGKDLSEGFSFEIEISSNGDQVGNTFALEEAGKDLGNGYSFEMKTSSHSDQAGNPYALMQDGLSEAQVGLTNNRLQNSASSNALIEDGLQEAQVEPIKNTLQNSADGFSTPPMPEESEISLTNASLGGEQNEMKSYGSMLMNLSPKDLHAFLEFANRSDNDTILQVLGKMKIMKSKPHGRWKQICWEMTELTKIVSMDPMSKDSEVDAVNNIRLKVGIHFFSTIKS